MGTRSYSAYQLGNGQIHAQYMQFDGHPTSKGKEFFEHIRRTLTQMPTYFLDTIPMEDPRAKADGYDEKERRVRLVRPEIPNERFFGMIRDYLNFKRWQTPHSYGDTADVQSYQEFRGATRDVWIEWAYLVDRAGNFHVFTNWDPKGHRVTIPLPMILAMEDYHLGAEFRDPGSFHDFWLALELSDPDEEEAALRECEREQTEGQDREKRIESQRRRVELAHAWRGCPVLTIDVGEVLAFPEQEKYGEGHGFREYQIVSLGDTVLVQSQFANYRGRKRNKRTLTTSVIPVEDPALVR